MGYDQVQCGGTAATRRGAINFTDAGATCTDDSANNRTNVSGLGGTSANSFETISVPAGTNPVADSSTDTLTITEDTFLTLTGTAATDTIAITQVTTDIGTDGLIAANAVALGTDTTNNYVASIADAGNSTITVVGSGAETAAITLDVVDVNCTDCLGTTEIADSYVLNTGDTMTGDLALALAGPDITLTPTGGDAAGLHAELSGVADTEVFLKNDTRFILDETPGGLWLGGNSAAASAASVTIKSTATGNQAFNVPASSISLPEVDTTNTFSSGQFLSSDGAGRFQWATAGGDAITVNSAAATDPDFANGDIDWTLTGGNSITATVACTGCVDATDLAADSVGTSEVAFNYLASVADAGNSTISTTSCSGAEGAACTLDAVDLNCTDCIGTTEIADSYVLNTGDTMTGDLALALVGPDITITPTSGDAVGFHAELFGASDTNFFMKNDTRVFLEETPRGLILGGNSSVASEASITLKTTGTGDQALNVPLGSISAAEATSTLRNRSYALACSGTLSTSMNCEEVRTYVSERCVPQRVELAVTTAPTTQAIIVDINECGTPIADCNSIVTAGNRPQIAASASSGNTTTFADTIIEAGKYIGFDLDQVGSGTTGSNLTATFVCQVF